MEEKSAAQEQNRGIGNTHGEYGARAVFYRAIIERYKDYINEREQKTIPMLKSLVDPQDPVILKIREGIVAKIREKKQAAAGGRVVETLELEYTAESDLMLAAKAAFEYAQSLSRTNSELSISFWLSYSEMESLGIADSFDRALLLCSLLCSLGSKGAKVCVLQLDDGTALPTVIFDFANKSYLLDPSNSKAAFGDASGTDRDSAASVFASEKGAKVQGILYSFNAEEYEEAEEE